MKVEGRKRKRQKRIGSGKTKLKKYILHLENRKQQKKRRKKMTELRLHYISVLGRYPQETQVKYLKDRKATA